MARDHVSANLPKFQVLAKEALGPWAEIRTSGYPSAIVQQQFTMHANSSGLVSGSIYGNNQISCGNVQSTEWIVQQFKASNQPSGLPQYYCLNSPTSFNPSTAQPLSGSSPSGALPVLYN
jgi:hypothetical protein